MFARLLPHREFALVAHELSYLGHADGETVAGTQEQRLTWKLSDIPQDMATALVSWLGQQSFGHWCASAPGAQTSVVDMLLSGSPQLLSVLRATQQQEAPLHAIAQVLEQALALHTTAPSLASFPLLPQAHGRRVAVMGILNVTPDSFSDGGLYFQPEQAMKHAETMLAEGADIIDVGGQSSRPGAQPVPVEVEYERVVPVVRDIVKRYDAIVSVDTYRARVAAAALDAGARVINDISALRFDAQMAPLLARRGATVVLMHMQGTPQTMQRAPSYHHVIDDVYGFLAERLHWAMQCGIPRHHIMLDPGFGFGKTVAHNLELLRGLESFRTLGQPLLVGTSRKSFLGRLLQRQVWDRLGGTMATVIYAILHGASIVRVHDVGPVAQAVRVLETVDAPALASPDARP